MVDELVVCQTFMAETKDVLSESNPRLCYVLSLLVMEAKTAIQPLTVSVLPPSTHKRNNNMTICSITFVVFTLLFRLISCTG